MQILTENHDLYGKRRGTPTDQRTSQGASNQLFIETRTTATIYRRSQHIHTQKFKIWWTQRRNIEVFR